MGFFDFVKDVGKKIVGATSSAAATAENLVKEVASHGFDTSKFNIAVDGNKVSIEGNAESNEEAERIILALGNTVGVEQVASNLVVNTENPPAEMYTVKKGDTLWKIAEHYYGKGSEYPKIVEANNPPITNPDLIQPGWVLRIPGK